MLEREQLPESFVMEGINIPQRKEILIIYEDFKITLSFFFLFFGVSHVGICKCSHSRPPPQRVFYTIQQNVYFFSPRITR